MHSIGSWNSLPPEILGRIFSCIDLKQHLALRTVSQTWNEIFDGSDEYWKEECCRRFGNPQRIYRRINEMQEYRPLFEQQEAVPFKVFAKLQEFFSKYRGYPPLISDKKYQGFIKNLFSREDPKTGEIDLYFLDQDNILRVMRQGEYLSGPFLDKAAAIAQLPALLTFNCLCQAGAGVLAGTEEGMLYYIPLDEAEPCLYRLLEEPLKGPVLTVSASQENDRVYAVVQFKEVLLGETFRSWVFRIDLAASEKKAERILTEKHVVKPNPVFLDGNKLLFAKQNGGVWMMDLGTGKLKEAVVFDPDRPDREPEIVCLCALKDRIVINTEQGQFGTIAIDELNNGFAVVSWKKLFRGPLVSIGMRPIGRAGFCVYTDTGYYWVLPKWDGEWVWNGSGQTGMKNIRWLENGHVVYVYGEEREAGIYVLDYTASLLQRLAGKIRYFWEEFLLRTDYA